MLGAAVGLEQEAWQILLESGGLLLTVTVNNVQLGWFAAAQDPVANNDGALTRS